MRSFEWTVRFALEMLAAAVLAWLLFTLCALVDGRAAHAYDPDEGPGMKRAVAACNEPRFLAQVLVTEANDEPDDAHWAVLSIVVAEAQSRGMNVCELAMRTHFLSVWHWVQTHPDSWTARVFASDPPRWAWDMAQIALWGRAPPDARHNAMHFDGASPCGRAGYALLWQSGQICFYR